MAGYIGRQPLSEAVQSRVKYTSTAGQTSYSFSYQPGFVDVFLNGIKLEDTTDFIATNGTDIILTLGASVGQVLEAVGLTTFSLIQGKHNYDATSAPSVTDDSADGYRKGSMWIDTATNDIYRCTDDTAGAAVWVGTTLEVTDLGTLATKSTVTDAELTSAKLNAIEDNATADQTNAEIKAAYEANTDTNEFSDAEQTKLGGIATSANNYSHPANHSISEVSGLQTALNTKTTPGYVDGKITDLIGGAPGTLDSLSELATAINNDASYASTLTTALATKTSKTSSQSLSTAGDAMTISGSTITLARGDGTTDTVVVPTSPDTNTWRDVSDSTSSTSTTVSASSKAVKAAYDMGNHSHPYNNYSHPSTHPASMLTGALPAIDGSALTGIDAATVSTTAPSSSAVGDMWFNNTSGVNIMSVWNGTGWNQMSNIPFSATGGTESTYSSGGVNYKVHTFTSSGTFSPTATGDVDILVVAGGGGSGNVSRHNGAWSSGGGGGGLIYQPAVSASAGSHSITIGSGGGTEAQGGDTSCLGYTAIGGGRGAGTSSIHGGAGGSGGGGRGDDSPATSGGSGTSGQGNSGGPGINPGGDPYYEQGGGGGGAGEAGNTDGLGYGGDGVDVSSYFGTSYGEGGIFAGGGAGGSGTDNNNTTNYGGTGGGGDSRGGYQNTIIRANGSINTGGGAGAPSRGGGSGIVIIRYAI